jgi:FlgD Ig-like domain
VPRLFSTALLFTLIGATAVAFVVTEGLKLEPSPVTRVAVTKVFSPTCECPTNLATIRFKLRRADRLTLSIVDTARRHVRTLIGPVARRKGRVSATWDGLDEDGAVVPDGAYRPLVQLRHRTILMPNTIRVDTTPPVVKLRQIGPRVIGPRGKLKVRYTLSEPARVYVFLDGRRILRGRSTRLKWNVEGEVHARPGQYRVTVAARDRAGNLSNATRPFRVVVPLEVRTPRVRVAARRRFVVQLVSDGRAYFWRLGAREGFARAQRLVLRAPAKPGRYVLLIRQDKVPHRVPVTVRR